MDPKQTGENQNNQTRQLNQDKKEGKNQTNQNLEGQVNTQGNNQGNNQGDNPENKQQEDTYKIKVDGKELELTRDEMIERAQKGTAAESRMQKASEMMENARTSKRATELVSKITKTGQGLPEEEAEELAGIVGGQKEYFMDRPANNQNNQSNQQYQQYQNNQGSQEAGVDDQLRNQYDNTSQMSNMSNSEKRKLSLEDLPEDVQEAVQEVKNKKNNEQVEKMKNNIKESLDNDDETNKIVSKFPEDKREKIKDELFDLAFKEMSLAILSGRQKYGPDLTKTAVQKARSLVKQFGIQNDSGSYPNQDNLGGILQGLGPRSDMSTQQGKSDEPIKRVNSNNRDYADNFVQRLARKLAGNS